MERANGCGEEGENISRDYRLAYTQQIASFGEAENGSGDMCNDINEWSLFGRHPLVGLDAFAGDGGRPLAITSEEANAATTLPLPESDIWQNESSASNALKLERNIDDVRLLLDDYKCPICLDTFINTVKVDCSYGHKFCSFCIQRWISIGSQLVTDCPVCRDPIFGKRLDLKTDAEIRYIVDQLPEEEKAARLLAIKERLQNEFPNVNFHDDCHVEFPSSGTSTDIPHRGLRSPLWELTGTPRAAPPSEATVGVNQHLDLGSHIEYPDLNMSNGLSSMYTSGIWNPPYTTSETDGANGRDFADFQMQQPFNHYSDRYGYGLNPEDVTSVHNGIPWCLVHNDINSSSNNVSPNPTFPHCNFHSDRFSSSQIHRSSQTHEGYPEARDAQAFHAFTCPQGACRVHSNPFPGFLPYSTYFQSFCNPSNAVNATHGHHCCYQPFCTRHAPVITTPTATEQLARFGAPGHALQAQTAAGRNVPLLPSTGANQWATRAGLERGTLNAQRPRLVPRMPAMFGMSFNSPWPVSMCSILAPNSHLEFRTAQNSRAGSSATAFSLQPPVEGSNLYSIPTGVSPRPTTANAQTSTLTGLPNGSSSTRTPGSFGGHAHAHHSTSGERAHFSGGFSLFSEGYVGFQVTHTPSTILPDAQNTIAAPTRARITHPIVSLMPLSRDGSSTRISLTFEIHRA